MLMEENYPYGHNPLSMMEKELTFYGNGHRYIEMDADIQHPNGGSVKNSNFDGGEIWTDIEMELNSSEEQK